VALDDFGTGYSSLAHRKKFDIGYPKLIGLLCETWGDADDQVLFKVIIVMAHKD
jgi:EAL domain-containing protein (putative c-di-GMP-specific phosphodiesterase class I)